MCVHARACARVCMRAPVDKISIIHLARLSGQEPCLFTAVSMEPRAASGIPGFLAYVKETINQSAVLIDSVLCSATSRL